MKVIKTDLFTAPIPYAVRFIKFFVIAVFIPILFSSNAMSQEVCRGIVSDCRELVSINSDSAVFKFMNCDTTFDTPSMGDTTFIGLNVSLNTKPPPQRYRCQLALGQTKLRQVIDNLGPGFYDIWTGIEYSGLSQTNESYYLDINGGPCDTTNVGPFLVIVPDANSTREFVYKKIPGKYYLDYKSEIYLKHFKILVDSGLFEDSLLENLVNCKNNETSLKNCFGPDESVHLQRMRLVKSADPDSSQISLTKEADKDTVRTGEIVHYTLTLTNESSEDTARTIILKDELPDSVILHELSISPPADTVINAKRIVWKLDSLAPGGGSTFSYNVSVIKTEPDSLVNRSDVHVLSTCEVARDSAVVVVRNDPEVSIMKTVEPDTVNCGQPFIYSIVAQNIGDGTARTVVVGDIMPDPVQFVRYISEPPGISDPNNDRGHIWNIGDLEPGESKLIQFEAVYPVEGDPSKNPLVNRACVISLNDFNPSNNCDTDTLWVKCPPLRCDCMLDRNVFEPEKTDPLRISFRLGAPGPVKLMILDITGYLITTLAEQDYTTGEHVFEWDGRRTEDGQKVGSGTYIVYFWSNNCDRLKKVILVR